MEHVQPAKEDIPEEVTPHLPKVYDKQVSWKEKLLIRDYTMFGEVAMRCQEIPEYLTASFHMAHPHLELTTEDIAASHFRDSVSDEGAKITMGYGFMRVPPLDLYDISLVVPDEVWFGNEKPGLRERLQLPEGSVGCLLPSVFIGEQESFPLSLIAERTGPSNWYNEFAFIYKIVNGYSKKDYEQGVEHFDKLFLQRLFSLNYEVLRGVRDWEFSHEEDGAPKEKKSMKEAGGEYIDQLSQQFPEVAGHKKAWQSSWDRACDSLKTMSMFSDLENLNHYLVSYALLAAEDLNNFPVWAEQLVDSRIREPEGLARQLLQVVGIKLKGGADLQMLENRISEQLNQTLR